MNGVKNMSLLEIKSLSAHYFTNRTIVRAVNDVTLSLDAGRTLGLVGETGAGKTTTALSIIRLIANPPGKITGGEVIFDGKDLLKESERSMRTVRGNKISMIFQDPMTALNPIERVGDQISEVIQEHRKCTKKEAIRESIKMLHKVGIRPDRVNDYPHQFSGGMKQRVVIAIALACNPMLLIADEPTTALDVTIQAQVLNLMRALQKEYQMAMLLITHDLGVVADICDDVAIMYAGEIVESGTLEDIFDYPLHPYTIGLFGALPSLNKDVDRLDPIDGLMPDPTNLPDGCKFHERCPKCMDICCIETPSLAKSASGHSVRCHLYNGGA